MIKAAEKRERKAVQPVGRANLQALASSWVRTSGSDEEMEQEIRYIIKQMKHLHRKTFKKYLLLEYSLEIQAWGWS